MTTQDSMDTEWMGGLFNYNLDQDDMIFWVDISIHISIQQVSYLLTKTL